MKHHERWDIVVLKGDSVNPKGLPAVVLSPDDVMSNRKLLRFNAVIGVNLSTAGTAKEHHVELDDADGLREPAFIDCSLVYAARKASIVRYVGSVTVHRRQLIQRAVRACLGLG